MHDPVEKPVAEHAQANHPGSRAISVQGEVREANCERPSHDREQAVRNRIVVEIERRDTGDTWRDADMLEAEEQKDWPDEIQESCGENKGAERGLGGEAFCGKGCTNVADKHVLEIRIPERL